MLHDIFSSKKFYSFVDLKNFANVITMFDGNNVSTEILKKSAEPNSVARWI